MRRVLLFLSVLTIATLSVGQTIEGRFYQEKSSFSVGEPLFFTMEIKNSGKQTIYVYSKVAGQCINTITFSAQHLTNSGSPACFTLWNLGCEDEADTLDAGEVFKASWPLDFWFRIQHQGAYRATLTRHMQISTAGAGVKEFSFKSDLEFTVKPADPTEAEQALRKFEADLNSKDPEVRHNALDAISATAPPYLQDVALRLARSKDVFDVAHGIGALRLMNTSEGNAALAEIISSRQVNNRDEENARCNAIKALGESGDASYLSMLAPYMEHGETCESEAAMVATARLGQANAVNRLQSFLQNPNSKLRRNAAFALRWTVAPDAVDALIGALRDKDEAVRQQAETSLNQLTGHSAASADQPSGTPLQLENAWRVWREKNRDASLVPVPPEFCRLD